MCGNNVAFIRNFKAGQHFAGVLHRFPIRLAAHDHSHQRKFGVIAGLTHRQAQRLSFTLGDITLHAIERVEIFRFDDIQAFSS